MIPGNGEESPEAFAADPMLILKHQHGIYEAAEEAVIL
jgi:hypothetical protein